MKLGVAVFVLATYVITIFGDRKKQFCKPIRKYWNQSDDNEGYAIHVFNKYQYMPIQFFAEYTFKGLEYTQMDPEEDEEEDDDVEGEGSDFAIDSETDELRFIDLSETMNAQESMLCEAPAKLGRAFPRFSPFYYWPDGVVKFYLYKNASKYEKVLTESMEAVMKKSCVKFVKTDKIDDVHDTLQILYTDIRDYCPVIALGKMKEKPIVLKVGSGCKKFKIVLLYIGYSLGLYREYIRPDRDEYIFVFNPNLVKCIYRKGSVESPYDFASMMHRDFDYIVNSPHLSIVPKDPMMIEENYNHPRPNFYDYYVLGEMYKCPLKCKDKSFACNNDGYVTATSEGQCICACRRGFDGEHCDDKVEIFKCGRKFTKREGTISSPTTYPVDKKCVYWIQAPMGKHVAIQFDKFDLAPRNTLGLCTEEYFAVRSVGIYSNNAGRRLCGNELEKKWFRSKFEDIILIYKTATEERQESQFHATYFIIH